MKTLKEFRIAMEAAKMRLPSPEQMRARMQRRAARKQNTLKNAQVRQLKNSYDPELEESLMGKDGGVGDRIRSAVGSKEAGMRVDQRKASNKAKASAVAATVSGSLKKEGLEVTTDKEECPECKGKGCDHCDDKGYHIKGEKKDKEVKEGKLPPALQAAIDKKKGKKTDDKEEDKDEGKEKEVKEEALPIEKASKVKATANMKDSDEEGDVTPPQQGGSEDPQLTHMCATKVIHKAYGEGKPLHGEHAEPNAYGFIENYTVMFEHGIATVNTRDLEVLEEGSHGNHKKK